MGGGVYLHGAYRDASALLFAILFGSRSFVEHPERSLPAGSTIKMSITPRARDPTSSDSHVEDLFIYKALGD